MPVAVLCDDVNSHAPARVAGFKESPGGGCGSARVMALCIKGRQHHLLRPSLQRPHMPAVSANPGSALGPDRRSCAHQRGAVHLIYAPGRFFGPPSPPRSAFATGGSKCAVPPAPPAHVATLNDHARAKTGVAESALRIWRVDVSLERAWGHNRQKQRGSGWGGRGSAWSNKPRATRPTKLVAHRAAITNKYCVHRRAARVKLGKGGISGRCRPSRRQSMAQRIFRNSRPALVADGHAAQANISPVLSSARNTRGPDHRRTSRRVKRTKVPRIANRLMMS